MAMFAVVPFTMALTVNTAELCGARVMLRLMEPEPLRGPPHELAAATVHDHRASPSPAGVLFNTDIPVAALLHRLVTVIV